MTERFREKVMKIDEKAKYEGETKDGKKHGRGTMNFTNGIYEGDWQEDMMNGFGIFTFFSGSKYEGYFEKNLFHGQGTYTWADGKRFYGDYRDGKRNGYGKQEYKNGNTYKGSWVNDKKEGKGNLYYKNCDVYEGEWKNNKKDGFGILERKDGTKVQQWWTGGDLITEIKDFIVGENADKSIDSQLEYMINSLKSSLINPLVERTKAQQVQIEKLTSKVNTKQERHESELEKTEKKIIKLTKQLKQKTEEAESLNIRLESTQRKLEEEHNKSSCIICYERPRNTVLLPCMHFLFCIECTQALKESRCPNCRCTIHGKLQCLLQP